MPFKKDHKYRWKPESSASLDKSPICFKGRVGQKEALQDIPDWQDKVRDYIDDLIEQKPSD